MSFAGLIVLVAIILVLVLGWDAFVGIVETVVDYIFEITETVISKAKETSS